MTNMNEELTDIACMSVEQLSEYLHDEKVYESAPSTIAKTGKPALLKTAMQHCTSKYNQVMMSNTHALINHFDEGCTLVGVNKWIDGDNVVLARPTNKNGKPVNLFIRKEMNEKTHEELLRAYTLKTDIVTGFVVLRPYGFKGGWLTTKKDAQICIGFKGYGIDNKVVKGFLNEYSLYLPDDKETARTNVEQPQYDRF